MAMKSIQTAARRGQEALGIESPSHMKGLQVFIADIRNCVNKEQEEKRVEKELAKIRQKFTNTKSCSGYDKKKYVWKLLYAYMLGYDVDFGHFQAVELCSSTKFSEKTAGYLAVSLLLADNTEILRLIVNSIKNDMGSGNEHTAALALNTVANIGGSEFADNLFTDISKMLLNNMQLSPYLKRKACICLLRLYRRDHDSLQPDVWKQRLAALFHDRDIGVLTSVSGFMLGILEQGKFPIQMWTDIVPAVGQCLASLVQGDCPEHYEYYHVPAPWLQTKLLRILQFFPVSTFSQDMLGRINAILHTILTKPMPQRAPSVVGKKRAKPDDRNNRWNAEHAILFEAMNLMIEVGERCDAETIRTSAGLLGAFVSSPDPNIRYLGLETMARLAIIPSMHEYLERYKNLIMEKMREPDVSIRRQALNLLYALCRPENWQVIVDELLEILGQSDASLQEELVLKIAILAERNAPNFTWYVDVVFRMLESAPDSVSDEVWFRVVQVVTGFEDGLSEQEKTRLQSHAAAKAYQNLANQKMLHETLVKLGAYLIGEFGHLLPQNVAARAKFDAIYRHYARGSPNTKAIILLACAKLLNSNDSLKQAVMPMLEDLQDSHDVELQQRTCELLQMMRNEEFLDHVLFTMPVYAESVQQNNPLMQRLKFQSKSRAHTRAHLEEAAKSEGGILKSGRGAKSPRASDDSNRASDAPGGFGGLSPRGAPAGAAPARGRQDSDSSGSDSSDEGGGGHGAAVGSGPGAGAAGGQGAKDLWTQLCIMPQGRLYTSSSLILDLQQEYNAAVGRLTIMFTNPGSSPIGNIRAMIPDAPFMRSQQFTEPPATLGPGQQAPHRVQVQCLRPFLQPAKYLVEYCDRPGGQPIQVPLMLPAVMTKFITPVDMQMQAFRQYFDSFAGPPREHVTVGQSKVNPNQWPNYLTKGFNMGLVPGSDAANTLAAGTFNTGTPNPSKPGQMMTVPCMVRVEYNEQGNMVRITVRSEHGEVTQSLTQIMASYFVLPP